MHELGVAIPLGLVENQKATANAAAIMMNVGVRTAVLLVEEWRKPWSFFIGGEVCPRFFYEILLRRASNIFVVTIRRLRKDLVATLRAKIAKRLEQHYAIKAARQIFNIRIGIAHLNDVARAGHHDGA